MTADSQLYNFIDLPHNANHYTGIGTFSVQRPKSLSELKWTDLKTLEEKIEQQTGLHGRIKQIPDMFF